MTQREIVFTCLLDGGDPARDTFDIAIAEDASVRKLITLIKATSPIFKSHYLLNEYAFEDPSLEVFMKLKDLSDNLLEEHLHIIVRLQEVKVVVCEELTHSQDREQYKAIAVKLPSPSSASEKKLKAIQAAAAAHLHDRPLTDHGLLIELYHPIFDEFRTALRKSTPIAPRDYELAASICTHGANIYKTESDREDELYQLLDGILDVQLTHPRAAGPNSAWADGVVTVTTQGMVGYLATIETKNEIGSGHCDPAIQASFSYKTYWIQLDIDSADGTQLNRAARVSLALREDKKLVRFHYLEKIAEGNNTKPMFKAQNDEDGSVVVVKFVQKYNSDAHRLFAGFDLAPRLLYSGLDEGNTHGNCGSLQMIVMDFVEGATAYDILPTRLSLKQYNRVLQAVKILHADDFVIGDLRLPNSILHDETAKLVDFDWCAKEGTERYPNNLNDDEIKWHPDVVRGGEMRREHGDWMLQKLHPRNSL
ncbi:hypothetical protein HWV62_8265 [Athelia sp. TMB]|nr:hypothetical protein HWV62_8265 [Athelia sp. TMB]